MNFSDELSLLNLFIRFALKRSHFWNLNISGLSLRRKKNQVEENDISESFDTQNFDHKLKMNRSARF